MAKITQTESRKMCKKWHVAVKRTLVYSMSCTEKHHIVQPPLGTCVCLESHVSAALRMSVNDHKSSLSADFEVAKNF